MSKIIEFNKDFENKYQDYVKYVEDLSLSTGLDLTDLVHKAYLRCYSRVKKNNFEGDKYSSYVYVTINNLFKDEVTRYKRWEDISEDSIQELVEQQLSEEEDNRQDRMNYMSYIVNTLYDYVDKHFKPHEVALFKIYFKMGKKIGYIKLSQITGIGKSEVGNIIKKIKQDLNKNFLAYLHFEMKQNQLDMLIEETKQILTLDVINHYDLYLKQYRKLFNQNYVGCKCMPYRLKNKLQQWLVTAINKTNYEKSIK